MELNVYKGNWFVENLEEPKQGLYPAKEISISTDEVNEIITVWVGSTNLEEAKATAKLVAKSKEMLEMLKYVCGALYEADNTLATDVKKLITEITE